MRCKKNRVLFIMHELRLGGAERVITNVVNNFEDQDYEVHFCLFKKKGELIEHLNERIHLHILNSPRVIFGVFKLIRLIKRIKPILVLSSITHVNILLSILKKIPGISKYRIGVREVNNPSIRAKYLKKSRYLDIIYSKTINNLDFIVAQSSYMKKDLLETYRLNPNKIKVISNPIDTEIIERQLKESSKKRLFDDQKIKVLSVGGMRKQKNLTFLVEVFQYLNEKYHLYILGDGPEYSNLENLIKEKGLQEKVTLLGRDKNPYKYMDQADIFCLTSFYEGFPNVVIEANYCGKYVLAVRVPGVDDEVIEEGKNGSLLAEFDLEKFAKKIEDISKRQFDKNQIKFTTDKYRINKVVKEYKKLIG